MIKLASKIFLSQTAVQLAERDNINIITFDIIYELAQSVRALMEKRMASEKVRVETGQLKVSIVFLTDKNRQIIGGKVIEGEFKKGVKVEVFRREELVGKGRVINLQKNKKDIEKAGKGEECGLLYEGDIKIEVGDILQAHIDEKIKGEL